MERERGNEEWVRLVADLIREIERHEEEYHYTTPASLLAEARRVVRRATGVGEEEGERRAPRTRSSTARRHPRTRDARRSRPAREAAPPPGEPADRL